MTPAAASPSESRGRAPDPSVEEQKLDETELLLNYTLEGDVVKAKKLLVGAAESQQQVSASDATRAEHLMSCHHEQHGGNVVYIAAHSGKKAMLALFATVAPATFKKLSGPAAVRMLTFQRYSAVLQLAELNSEIVTLPFDAAGDHLLHVVCMRRRPPVAFIDNILTKFKSVINVDERNPAGLTALHLVAVRSSGIEGREAARALLLHGADEEATAPDGRNAAVMALNPFVRQVLGITGNVKPRALPQIDETSKAAIDACKDSSQFPPLKDFTAEINASLLATSGGADGGGADASSFVGSRGSSPTKRSGSAMSGGSSGGGASLTTRKLPPEATEAMVHRLYQQTLEARERWHAAQLSKLQELDQSHTKRLGGEEVEAAVSRLYASELERREEKRQEMLEKYLREPPKGPQLGRSELEDSANRLCRGSLQQKQKTHEELVKKYAPEHESRHLTKAELQSSAARLHDECRAKTKEKFDALYSKYVPPGEKKKLTKEQMQAMGSRLCTPKPH